MGTPLGLALDAKAAYQARSGIIPLSLIPAPIPVDEYQRAGDYWYEHQDDTSTDQARGAYAALAWECWAQFALMREVIDIEFCDEDPTPLGAHGGPSYAKIKAEVARRQCVRIYRSDGAHPILDSLRFTHANRAESANSVFRAVHDFYGHLATGGQFGWEGETMAYYSHAAMFSPGALPALMSETVLQQCYWAVHHAYAPQKCVLMPPTTPQPPLR